MTYRLGVSNIFELLADENDAESAKKVEQLVKNQSTVGQPAKKEAASKPAAGTKAASGAAQPSGATQSSKPKPKGEKPTDNRKGEISVLLCWANSRVLFCVICKVDCA